MKSGVAAMPLPNLGGVSSNAEGRPCLLATSDDARLRRQSQDGKFAGGVKGAHVEGLEALLLGCGAQHGGSGDLEKHLIASRSRRSVPILPSYMKSQRYVAGSCEKRANDGTGTG